MATWGLGPISQEGFALLQREPKGSAQLGLRARPAPASRAPVRPLTLNLNPLQNTHL